MVRKFQHKTQICGEVELCTPCNDEPSTLYAEVNSIHDHLPTSACKVAPQTEIIYTIRNHSKNFSFIIRSYSL